MAVAGDLQTALVVPLDHAVNFLAVAQHDHHRGFRLHLLLIVKVLGVGLFRGRGFSAATAGRPVGVDRCVRDVRAALWCSLMDACA